MCFNTSVYNYPTGIVICSYYIAQVFLSMPCAALWLASYPDGARRINIPGKGRGSREYQCLPLNHHVRQQLNSIGGDGFDKSCFYNLGPRDRLRRNYSVTLQALLKVTTAGAVVNDSDLVAWPFACQIMRQYYKLPLDCYSLKVEAVRAVANPIVLTHSLDIHANTGGQARLEARSPLVRPYWLAPCDMALQLDHADILESIPSVCMRNWGISGQLPMVCTSVP